MKFLKIFVIVLVVQALIFGMLLFLLPSSGSCPDTGPVNGVTVFRDCAALNHTYSALEETVALVISAILIVVGLSWRAKRENILSIGISLLVSSLIVQFIMQGISNNYVGKF